MILFKKLYSGSYFWTLKIQTAWKVLGWCPSTHTHTHTHMHTHTHVDMHTHVLWLLPHGQWQWQKHKWNEKIKSIKSVSQSSGFYNNLLQSTHQCPTRSTLISFKGIPSMTWACHRASPPPVPPSLTPLAWRPCSQRGSWWSKPKCSPQQWNRGVKVGALRRHPVGHLKMQSSESELGWLLNF